MHFWALRAGTQSDGSFSLCLHIVWMVGLMLSVLLCSFQQGAREGEEPGGGAQRPTVSLPRPHAVGQDPALRWRHLPVGVHGPGRVPVWERHSLQPLPAPPQPAPTTRSATPAVNHASSPAHARSVGDGPQQPRLHLRTHQHRLSKLLAQQPSQSR